MLSNASKNWITNVVLPSNSCNVVSYAKQTKQRRRCNIYIFENTQIFQNISEDAKVRGQRYLTNRQIWLQNISSEIIYYSKYFQGAGAVPAGACVLRQ